jgi:hypothetical protein
MGPAQSQLGSQDNVLRRLSKSRLRNLQKIANKRDIQSVLFRFLGPDITNLRGALRNYRPLFPTGQPGQTDSLLRGIVDIALHPQSADSIPNIGAGVTAQVAITEHEAAMLLANAFLCTFDDDGNPAISLLCMLCKYVVIHTYIHMYIHTLIHIVT